MKKQITIHEFFILLLFASTFFIGELKQLLPDDGNEHKWFLLSNESIQPIWYYYFLSKSINWVIVMYAVVKIAAKQDSFYYYWAAECYLFYRVMDMLAFIVNKGYAETYPLVYILTALFTIIRYIRHRNEKANNTW